MTSFLRLAANPPAGGLLPWRDFHLYAASRAAVSAISEEAPVEMSRRVTGKQQLGFAALR
jgi:hypothetical protein